MDFGLRIHSKQCMGCHACEVACKQEHDLPPGADLIRILEKIPRFQPVYCRHCVTPPMPGGMPNPGHLQGQRGCALGTQEVHRLQGLHGGLSF